MPKARTRLTLQKRPRSTARSSKRTQPDVGVPSIEDFEDYTCISKIVVEDKESNVEYTFKVGDCVMILGEGMDVRKSYSDSEFWVAEILALARQPGNRSKEFAHVRWFWSGKDIRSVARASDVGYFGRYERCSSKAEDIIALETISGPAQIVEFYEDDLDQEPILQQTFFTRNKFDLTKKKLKNLGDRVFCGICDRRYNPDEIDNPMHFCPQTTCGIWYHYNCLADCSSVGEYSNTQHHSTGLALSTPDYDPPPASSGSKKKRGPAPRSADSLVQEASMIKFGKMLDFLSQDARVQLIELAQQQIVRPTREDIVGNARRVLQARRWVYEARARTTKKKKVELEEKLEELLIDGQLASSRTGPTFSEHQLWVCMRCGGPI